MTELTDLKPLAEALDIIDAGLGGLTERELVSSNEVTNLLLDVRVLLGEIDLTSLDEPGKDEPAAAPEAPLVT